MNAAGARVLGGRYELSSLIASGGMGRVWRGRDTLLHRPVAVKVLRPEHIGDPVSRARLLSEAQHAAALSHPGIAALYDYGEEPAPDGSGEPQAYLVMELVDGEPLSDLLRREGRLSAERTVDLIDQCAQALAVAHRHGVVHRDVTPRNLLVTPAGRVKITDFGIAWSAASDPLTQTGQVVGTAQYLSPEQAEGRAASAASDVYALGMVGYECLAGRRAFDGDNSVAIALKQLRATPDPLPDDVPLGARRLVEHCLVKDPARRLADGGAVAAAVVALRAGRPLPAVPEPDARTTETFSLFSAEATRTGSQAVAGSVRNRRRVLAVLVPLVTLVVGALVAALVLGTQTAAPERDAAVTSSSAPPTTTVLTAADYVDRPWQQVLSQLQAAGLRVTAQPVPTADAAPGAVTGIEPVGVPLTAGAAVALSYAVGPPAPAPSSAAPSSVPLDPVQPSAVADTVSSRAAPGTTAQAPVPAPVQAPAPAGKAHGNGNGKGHGNGKGNGG